MGPYLKRPGILKLHPLFRMLAGVPEQNYLDCSAQPYDMRPASDLIVKTIELKLNSPKPLVVLMGERHAMPSHIALQHSVLNSLVEKNHSPAINFEIPHNVWQDSVRRYMELPIPEAFSEAPTFTHDPQGELTLSAQMGYWMPGVSPSARNDMFAFCERHNVPINFNDAARRGSSLDSRDAFSRACAIELGMDPQSIHLNDVDGHRVRHEVMAKLALAHAKASGSKIILQSCGIFHVLGFKKHSGNYHTSLAAAYERAGADILPVISTSDNMHWGVNMMPADANQALKQSLVIHGLCEDQFGPHQHSDGDTAEKRLLKKIYDASGGQLVQTDVTNARPHYQALAIARSKKVLSV